MIQVEVNKVKKERVIEDLPLLLDKSCEEGFKAEAQNMQMDFSTYLSSLLESFLDSMDISLSDNEEMVFSNYDDRAFDYEIIIKE